MSRTSTSKARSDRLESIFLYSSENADSIDLSRTKSFIESCFPTVRVTVTHLLGRSLNSDAKESIATAFAGARVLNPDRREQSHTPMFGEIDYETRVMTGEARAGGIVYDGFKIARAFAVHLRNPTLSTAHVLVTDRLVSTFSDEDLRHHLRTIIAGFPSVVSVPGIVEAPAKPREYYVKRQALEAMGASQLELESLKDEFKGRMLDYGDREISEVVKGLALQAILYHLTLQPFCSNKDCRFFNAHWQEDLIRSQITSGRFCARHDTLLRSLGRRPEIEWLQRTQA